MSIQNQFPTIKKILIAKASFSNISCPYVDLSKKHKLSIDFRPFLQTTPIASSDFRKFKQKILAHTAILFTNKIAIDHFFNLIKASNIVLSEETKYFCTTQPLGHYLQKHVLVRKRKLFQGEKGFLDLTSLIKKHKQEKFLFPCSNVSRKDIRDFFKKQGYKYTEIIIYNLLARDLTDLAGITYDIIVFFSPLEVKAFVQNFPDYTFGNTKIATFGLQTAKTVRETGWEPHILAPKMNAPSMVEALEQYLKTL